MCIKQERQDPTHALSCTGMIDILTGAGIAHRTCRVFELLRNLLSLLGVSAWHFLLGVRLLKKLWQYQPHPTAPRSHREREKAASVCTLTRFTGDTATRRRSRISILDFNLLTSSAKFPRLRSGFGNRKLRAFWIIGPIISRGFWIIGLRIMRCGRNSSHRQHCRHTLPKAKDPRSLARNLSSTLPRPPHHECSCRSNLD